MELEVPGAAKFITVTKLPEHGFTAGSFLFWLAASNILLMPFWGWLFDLATPFDEQFQLAINSTIRDRLQIGAGLFTLIGLSVAFTLGFFVISKLSRRAADILRTWVIVAIVVIVVNFVRYRYLPYLSYDAFFALSKWLLVVLGLGVFAATLIFRRRIITALCGFVWLSVPITFAVLVNVFAGIYVTAPTLGTLFNRPDLQPLHQESAEPENRVLWIIFDELDQRLGFEARPDFVEMPSFDDVAKGSFSATNARSPGPYTWESIPSMIVGEKIKGFDIKSMENMYVNWHDGRRKLFYEVDTIFSDANKIGVNTALFAHRAFRFCDLFFKFIQKCWFYHNWWLGHRDTAFDQIPRVIDRVLANIPLFDRIVYGGIKPRFGSPQYYIEDTKKMVADLSATVVDRNYGFIFAHFNIPHEPHIYDVDRNSYSIHVSGKRAYLGGLELADRIVGILKAAMVKEDIWDRTTVILSSDHWLRKNEYDAVLDKWRVPLFVKLNGQRHPIVSSKELHPVKMRHFIREILNGNVTDPAQIPKFLS